MAFTLYICFTAVVGLLGASLYAFRIAPSVVVPGESAAFFLDISTNFLFALTIVILVVNVVLPLFLWRNRTIYSIVPAIVSVASLLLFSCIESNRAIISLSYLERNEVLYKTMLTEFNAQESCDFEETYSSAVERYFITHGRHSYLSPSGVHVYRGSNSIEYIFFLNRSVHGNRSGYLYSVTGKFHAGYRQTGWYWPSKTVKNWAYFSTWYAEKQASGAGPNDGLPLIGLVFDYIALKGKVDGIDADAGLKDMSIGVSPSQ